MKCKDLGTIAVYLNKKSLSKSDFKSLCKDCVESEVKVVTNLNSMIRSMNDPFLPYNLVYSNYIDNNIVVLIWEKNKILYNIDIQFHFIDDYSTHNHFIRCNFNEHCYTSIVDASVDIPVNVQEILKNID